MTQHPDKVHIRPITTDHCLYAYVLNKKEEIGFCACFTCGKGTMGDGVSGNGSRWVEMHANKTDCKKAHMQCLAEFKQKMECMPKLETCIESISIQPTPVIIQSSVSISDSTICDNKEPIIINPTAQDKLNKPFDGFVYCFANESMPGILKIGMTKREPLDRLKEANSSDTWRPPTPYTIEFAKHVTKPREKESVLHKLLLRYTEKIHDRREFFRVSVDEVRLLFELMDGDYWEACK